MNRLDHVVTENLNKYKYHGNEVTNSEGMDHSKYTISFFREVVND